MLTLVWKPEYSRVLARLQWVRAIYFVTVVAMMLCVPTHPHPNRFVVPQCVAIPTNRTA